MKKSVAYVLVMVVGGFWGLSFIALSRLQNQLDNMEILALRWTLAAVVFLILIAAGKLHLNLKSPRAKFLMLTGIAEPCIYSIFEIYGLELTSPSISSIFIATVPCASLLVSLLFLGRKAQPVAIVSILLAFAGVLVTTVFSPAFNSDGRFLGYLLMLGAVAAGAFYGFVSAEAGREYRPMEVTAIMAFDGAILFNLICLLREGPAYTEIYATCIFHVDMLGCILFLGLCCSILCYLSFNKLLSSLDVSIANNLTGATTAAVGVIAGVLINGDPAGLYTGIGLFMTIAGVWLSSKSM